MLNNWHASAARSAHRRPVTVSTRGTLGGCTSTSSRSALTCAITLYDVRCGYLRRHCVASRSHCSASAEPQSARPKTPGGNNELTTEAPSGPPIKEQYAEAEEKALRDPSGLSAKELSMLVNGLPRHYRHKHVSPEFVEEAFDGGMLTLHELGRTLKLDLNVAVKQIGSSGQLRKALRLADYLVRTKKANQHTLAAFFQACAAVNRPTVAARVWEMWVPVCAAASLHCPHGCSYRDLHTYAQGFLHAHKMRMCLNRLPLSP